MKVNKKQIGKVLVLEIEGVMDAEHSSQIKKSFSQVQEEGEKNIVLDLNKVSFIDSTGLGILISLMRHLNEQEGRLQLSGLQDEVKSIFEITRLFRVFEISQSVEQAIQEIQKK